MVQWNHIYFTEINPNFLWIRVFIRLGLCCVFTVTSSCGFMSFLRTTVLMKRQHCRQLWHYHWLKTDNSHTTSYSQRWHQLHCCCSSTTQKVSSSQQTHLTQIHTVCYFLFTPRMFFLVQQYTQFATLPNKSTLEATSLLHSNLMIWRHLVGLEWIQWLYQEKLH